MRKQGAVEIEKMNREKNLPQKFCFVTKITRTSPATSNNPNLNSDAGIPYCNKASSSEEEDIEKKQCRIISRDDIINEAVKGSSSKEEDIGYNQCRIISIVDIINEAVKGISSEQEYILIRKCRIRSQVDIINEEVKVWKSSSKQQEAPTEPTNTKEDIRL